MEIREMVLIDITLIELTNSRTNKKVVKKIAKKLNWQKFKAVPAYWNGKKFLITDGNHRVKAAAIRGEKYIPAILITKKEFDHVAYTTNTLDFMVQVPEVVKRYTAKNS